MPPVNPDPLLTAEEVADYLGMSLRFVRHEIASQAIISVRLGRLVKIRHSAVESYIASRSTEAP